jgi:hypothetical protein
MANTAPPRYTVQVAPTFEPEVAAEFMTWAQMRGVSIAQLVRELAEAGLRVRRAAWKRELKVEDMDQAAYLANLEHARRRGEKAVANRRAYDADTRTPRGEGGVELGEEEVGEVAA